VLIIRIARPESAIGHLPSPKQISDWLVNIHNHKSSNWKYLMRLQSKGPVADCKSLNTADLDDQYF